MEIEKELNGEGKVLEPFPPGTFEEYDILESGKVKLVRTLKYFSPGDKPSFKPLVPYEGKNLNCIQIVIIYNHLFLRFDIRRSYGQHS